LPAVAARMCVCFDRASRSSRVTTRTLPALRRARTRKLGAIGLRAARHLAEHLPRSDEVDRVKGRSMTAMGLGRVKTPAPAARVETSRSDCAS
jgi:hypothetical protein